MPFALMYIPAPNLLGHSHTTPVAPCICQQSIEGWKRDSGSFCRTGPPLGTTSCTCRRCTHWYLLGRCTRCRMHRQHSWPAAVPTEAGKGPAYSVGLHASHPPPKSLQRRGIPARLARVSIACLARRTCAAVAAGITATQGLQVKAQEAGVGSCATWVLGLRPAQSRGRP